MALPQSNEILVLATDKDHAALAKELKELSEEKKSPGPPIPDPRPKERSFQFKDVPRDDVLKWYAETRF